MPTLMNPLVNLPTASALAVRRTTPDHVVEVLREAILTGALAEGVELKQVALADHFEVSRVPVREALRQLQAEGLVRQESYRRAVVTTLSRERLLEMFDLRKLLESHLLREASKRLTRQELDALDELLDRMEALDAAAHEEWLRLNRAFHNGLCEASCAGYTLELTEKVAGWTTRYFYLSSGGRGVDRVREAQAEHRDIIRLLRGGDARSAVKALEAHIDGTRRRLLEFLDQRAVSDDS